MRGIEIKALSKSYGDKKALDDIHIQINQPGVYLIAGPNGSGKTTLFETLVGLRKADSGTITINGGKLGSIEAKKALGFLSQQNSLRKNCTVKEEFDLIQQIYNCKMDTKTYLERFNLEHTYTQKTRQLSGGTKRRVLIAMLFMVRQPIVILDEPVSGLDTFSRDEIWNMISEYSKENIIIISDHYLNQAALYSDYIYLINEGRIVLEDTPANLVRSCKLNQLVKVRKESFKDLEHVLKTLNKNYEVRVSGTVYNIFTDNQHMDELVRHQAIKYTVHSVGFEDVYFYHTGKYMNSEEQAV